MSVSFSSMNTRLASMIRDESEEKFTSSSGSKLTALNLSVKDILFYILSLSDNNKDSRKKAIYFLRKLKVSESIQIPSIGYNLSSLTKGTFHDFGFISCFVYTNSEKVPVFMQEEEMDMYETNAYFVGSDIYPKSKIVGTTLFVEVDMLSYPLDAEITYIREHKTGILSGTPTSTQTLNLELPDSFENLVLKLAKEYLFDSSQDYEQSKIAREKFLSDFALINGIEKQ